MGNIVATEPELSQEQIDLQSLRERMPFADAEIRFLYEAYRTFGTIDERQSFLYDWSYCVGAHGLFEVLQEHVLPRGANDERFGNALYYAIFHVDGDHRLYNHPDDSTSPTATLVDEYTRKARLEQFFEGLATVSRRGSTAVLKALFHTVSKLHESKDDRVLALDFVEAGYRVAFAADHLQTGGPKAALKEIDVSRESLGALAHSVVNKAKSRRQRTGIFDECPHLQKGRVELQDILDWAESVAPMFGAFQFRFSCLCAS